jgi:ATP-dependent helicase/nuclease subunit A
METDTLEIKRQMDSAGDRIRVMTVHGAKGLEAPLVILPDTAAWRLPDAPEIVAHDGVPLWRGKSETMPPLIAGAVERARAAQLAERDRLLYVAMTRAETWLIAAGAGDPGKDGLAWHSRIQRAMEALGAAPLDTPTGTGLRIESGIWAETVPAKDKDTSPEPPPLPPYFQQHAPACPGLPKPRNPSDLGGAKALPGEGGLDAAAATRRGRQIHRLLEVLPEVPRGDWDALGAHLLATGPDAAGPEEIALLLAEAGKVLEKPALAPLFSADALAEVPISAPLGADRIHGVIDRLILDPERILAVDFKTNAILPERPEDCPEAILRQMGAYAHALALLYPGRRIETAILWTRTATLMPLPHALVTAALARASGP